MSKADSKSVFEQILKTIRVDLEYIRKANQILVNKTGDRLPDRQTQDWIMDVFVDKIFEIEGKVVKLATNVEHFHTDNLNTDYAASRIREKLTEFAFEIQYYNLEQHLEIIVVELNSFIKWVEFDLSEVRRALMANGWQDLNNIEPTNYVSLPRKKFVSARDELVKAKNKINDDFDDVMIYLRNAIDYALKEKYGFNSINPMKVFIENAAEYNFPLPSYDLIYYVYNEGSQRIHKGQIHTKLEIEEAIRMVDNFIDNLEFITVTKQQIDEFKKKCKAVT